MDSQIRVNIWIRWCYGIFLGVLFNFILDIIFSLVYKNYSLFQPLTHYLVSIFLTYLIFETLFLVNQRLNRIYSWERHLIKRSLLQFVADGFIALFLTTMVRWGIKYLSENLGYIALQDEMILIAFVICIDLVFVMSELSIFLLTKWRFSLAELERFKKENAEFRFELLRSQLNPHFLFNSLNTLSSLIYENQENAGHFVRELSDTYRYILENRDKEVIHLHDEIEFAKSYINLVQLRFDKNLEVRLNLSEADLNYKIAPLTIQMLIENAIKHNVISKKYPLFIDIFAEDGMLVVTNKIRLKQSKDIGTGTGLKNISNRYEFLTVRNVIVTDNGEDFTVKIPLILSN
ncbi:MAG: histidine kinase [Bacteroidales bacterium]|nr:histidine kinase [Bacteroidales bacterium]